MNPIFRVVGGVVVCGLAAVLTFWGFDLLFMNLTGDIHSNLILLAILLGLVAMVPAGIAWQRFAARKSKRN